ncbi:SAM hydrolase/SAM-dependent halogenase family protein [Natronosalvus vescus]|uniref:SAM hydrolase/SAM-dependent halogenase family protein n=1 Tax=Natronosalvus vescus TaxID=2953881 RepID=UPI0020905795|nr:SAM-dependent chlorinase/fluorinase [Natronosalvus vescus]
MITLSSDFGSPYPAAMKGVLLERTDSRLVDVAHDFPRGDIRASAFWLREVLPYYPPATHLVVVDPGVGTDRHAIVVRAGDHVLVGPDNGVLLPVAQRLAGQGGDGHDGAFADALDVFRVDEDGLETPVPTGSESADGSTTFHGRDVFAPAAAAVESRRVSLDQLSWSSPLESPVEYRLPAAEVSDERVAGEVLVVDDFGNLITNVPGTVLEDVTEIVANGDRIPVGDAFATVHPGERVALVGSHGNVELDVNDGRGDDAFGLEAGDDVVLEWV